MVGLNKTGQDSLKYYYDLADRPLVCVFPGLFDSSKYSLSPLSILLLLIILDSRELGCFDARRCLSLSLSLHEYSSDPSLRLRSLCSLFLLVTPPVCPAVVLQVPLKPIKGARNKFVIWQNGTKIEIVKRYMRI